MCENPSVTKQDIIDNLTVFVEYNEIKRGCSGCSGLHECKNRIHGHASYIQKSNRYAKYKKGNCFELTYQYCPFMLEYKRIQAQKNCIRSVHVSENVLSVKFSDIETDELGHLHAIRAALDFTSGVIQGIRTKGLYLYGPFGVGKSFFAAAIANELAKHTIPSTFVYVPDFFRELRSSIKEGTVEEKIDYIKETPVLILDDIGAECISTWLRDDILGSILQYRSANGLPTVYTSNLSISELEHHLSYTYNTGEEKMKAARLMERITPYVDVIEVQWKNRRRAAAL
ncbi:primosomal protein DnaI [Bacillus sp. S2(2024)]|uniref:primosomal protein DnaI n=1 Tax=Bacillus sp. S2(2024) TaxID=3162887 RepID=UPI003D1D94FA